MELIIYLLERSRTVNKTVYSKLTVERRNRNGRLGPINKGIPENN